MTQKRVHEPRSPIVLRRAWLLKDPAIERDAELFWRRERLLPETVDAGKRLKELCLAGYDEGRLVALSTARVRPIEFLGVKLAMLRVAVAPEQRRNRLATYIQAESRELLERWSMENPAEQVLGMGTITQSRELLERARPERAFQRDARLGFVGWTANGEIMRVAWFEHATLPSRRPDAPEVQPKS